MISKIVEIQNVGRFTNVAACGNVTLRRVTLIFAPNARGKTTLGAILRSLKTGDADWILGRKTLGSGEDPKVKILVNGSLREFTSGKWSTTYPEIEIFDDTFVADNVYSGASVEHGHKKNLYTVVLGEDGVTLARRIVEIDRRVREIDQEKMEIERDLSQYVPEGLGVPGFVQLSVDTEIEEKIEEAERTLSIARTAREIAKKPTVVQLEIPDPPSDLRSILTRTLTDVEADAERRLREHLDKHTQEAREEWLERGLSYIKNDTCPFCGQDLDERALIRAYSSYFSASYRQLTDEIQAVKQAAVEIGGEGTCIRIQSVLSSNEEAVSSWDSLLDIDFPNLSGDDLVSDLVSASSVLGETLERKVQSPLNALEPGEDFASALATIEEWKARISEYNSQANTIKELITAKKSEAAKRRPEEAEARLHLFKAQKSRHEPPTKVRADGYQALMREREQLSEEKAVTKDKLDDYGQELLAEMEQEVNGVLQNFGASFRLRDFRRRYVGGRPSTSYALEINAVSIDLGDSKDTRAVPSFQNTLSAGDRSTLALAFFLARTTLDSQLEDKVLVFDDPFTSQDRFRRRQTSEYLNRLAQQARQVVLLSHEQQFLREVWNSLDRQADERHALQLIRSGRGSSNVGEWDIEAEVRDECFRRIDRLSKYLSFGRGSAEDVVKEIRPTLEDYLRQAFPGSFPLEESLGDYIRRIREAEPGTPIYTLRDDQDEYCDLNRYTRRYMHGARGSGLDGSVDEDEVATYVQRTLQLINYS